MLNVMLRDRKNETEALLLAMAAEWAGLASRGQPRTKAGTQEREAALHAVPARLIGSCLQSHRLCPPQETEQLLGLLCLPV